MTKSNSRILLLILSLCLSTLSAAVFAANPKVALETNFGTIVVELEPDKAPNTVKNFLSYVNDGFYNGTIFHRVIDGFMVQGGGFTESFSKKPTKAPIKNEADNGLHNDRLTIAMARTGDPHSATAQFFINTVNNTFLNFSSKDQRGWGYAVFGKVIQGADVVDKISKMPTGPHAPFRSDVPKTTVIIKSAKVIK
jgi:cyclophilin family peptidyl-prolyl cis-trans isomerase